MKERMNERMNERRKERMNERRNERRNELCSVRGLLLRAIVLGLVLCPVPRPCA